MHLETDKPIMLAGDWHGSISQAAKVIDAAQEQGIKLIFQLGDFGIWYNDKPYLNKMQQRLEENGQTLYFVDGNHEDFPRLYAKPLQKNGTRKVRDSIFHLPRGFRFTVNETSFLALGGAASIDRKFRVLNKSYWEQELITEADVMQAWEGGYADVMLCHDSPATAPNSIVDDVMGQMRAQLSFGSDALLDCAWNRNQLDRVFLQVKPKYLFHGHYHECMIYPEVPNGGGTTHVQGLDEGVAKLPLHTAVFRA